MDTDQGFVADYMVGLSEEKIKRLKIMLFEFDDESVDKFIDSIRDSLSFLKSHLMARVDIPDAKEQLRFAKKLETKIKKLQKLSTELSELLDEAPFELRQKATSAGSSLSTLQIDLFNVNSAINDLSPKKSKYRPEIKAAVYDIGKSFLACLGVEPKIRSWRIHEEVPINLSKEDLFVRN